MKNKSAKILIIAGPSGVGKSTLIKYILENYPQFNSPVSATTRSQRDGEINGESYHFFTEAHFRQAITDDLFLEWEEVYPSRFYGTLRSEYEKYLAIKDSYLVADVDVLGALNLKNYFGDRVFMLFVRPESTRALIERLKARGTDTDKEIQKRTIRFEEELSYEDRFDEVVVNKTGQVQQAIQDMVRILEEQFNV